MKNLILIGFMGAGKSAIGRMCAAKLGYTFRDSDAVIEQQAGCAIAQLFASQGEAAFRQCEREVIAELAGTPGLVISTGGGVVLDPANVEALRASGLIVWLTATPEVILKRVGDARTRPLLASAPDPRARIAEMLAERAPKYESAAHCVVSTTDRPLTEITAEVVALYHTFRESEG